MINNSYFGSFLNLVLIVMLTGAMLNVIAIATNDGRMPFKADYNYSDRTHFSYSDDSEVNEPLLTDRFKLPGKSYVSLGDLFLFFGFCNIVGMIFVKIVNIIRGRKR